VTDLSVFRVYEPWECGDDGYPHVWHRNCGTLTTPQRDAGPPSGALDNVVHDLLDSLGDKARVDFSAGVKHIVREEAGHRCLRCGHPFIVGQSGTHEQPTEANQELQAEVGGLFYDGMEPDVPQPKKAINWSSCDGHCTHGGPIRVMSLHGWQHYDGEAAKDIAAMVSAKRVQAAWRILTVHHLNERKHDLRWWNLAALCQRCHLYIQRKVTMERVYPLEHSEWFKPFAAGWYAYAYLGEDLTREQTMGRMDELLALERLL
jgi:hypothetical protein